MEVYQRPAQETLVLPEKAASAPSWAVFDPAWYRATYPDAPELPDDALLEWHLRDGQTRAYSPNRYFAEAWQRRFWPGIQALIDGGAYPSAFDAWCRGAHVSRQPHWLFDPAEYFHRFPDLTPDALARAGLVNLYDHYLRLGAPEGRIGHPLFDPAFYVAHFDPEDARHVRDMPFDHYLRRLERHEPELRPSLFFRPDWYAGRYPAAARLVDAGVYGSLLEHYLCNDTPSAFDPSPWFSEEHYLAANPGIAAALGPAGFRDGFSHFLKYGLQERRSPHPDLDLDWYASRPEVKAGIAAGKASDAFVHWILIGLPGGLPGRPTPAGPVLGPEATVMFQRRADAVWSAFASRKIDFSHDGAPSLTAIMVPTGGIARTLVTLTALRACYRGQIDLILIDSGGSAAGEDLETYLTGQTVLRFGVPLTAAASRDAGLVCAAADTVLFLDDGIDPLPGAIERLNSDPSIGAVGARLMSPDGTIFEAGGIVWRDGGLTRYCQGQPPLTPEANFVRDTDYCSTRFLVARKSILDALEDQAEGIAGTGHDSADFCVRIQRAGGRVVYDPGVLVFLPVGPEDPDPDGQAAFAAAHQAYLAGQFDPGPEAPLAARGPGRGQRRILFVEDSVPLRRIGSGFVRSNDVVRALAAAGAEVTVYPMRDNGFPFAAIRTELPETVEVMHDRTVADFAAFRAARQGHYHTVWIARTHNLDLIHQTIDAMTGPDGQRVRIVADTEAVASLRRAEQAAVMDEPFDLEAALRDELRNLGVAAAAVAVTEAEAEVLRGHFPGPVAVLGHGVAAAPTARPFEERAGILFVGAVHGMTHPNYDGLVWFVDEVLPRIEESLGWRTRLTVAGYIGPEANLDRFKGHARVTLRGPMADLTPLYASHRVAVAPARFAAGIPYKVHEAAGLGVPIVTTTLLARQLGWEDGEALGAADRDDPAGFAARVVALHGDEALWTRIRDAALDRVRTQLDRETFAARAVALASGDAVRPATTPVEESPSFIGGEVIEFQRKV